MLPRLISFSGYATSGKDAAANALVHEQHFVKTYMSKPLEQALLTLDPWVPDTNDERAKPVRYSDIHDFYGYDESKKNPEVRRLLQTLGTEIGRNMFGEDSWLDLVCEEIREFHASGTEVCLTGVRYRNELDRVRAFDGVAVWIDRPGVEALNNHSSENTIGPQDCDVVIMNSGTLDVLSKRVNMLFPPSETKSQRPKIVNHSECKWDPSHQLTNYSFSFRCDTHGYTVFMPIDKAPNHCPMYESETA